MRERDVGQAGRSWRAFMWRGGGGGSGRCLGGNLKGVVVGLSSARNLPRSGEEDSAGSFNVARRRGARIPLVAEGAAEGLRIEPGDGRIKLDGGRQKRREKMLRRISVLGPRRGPRGCTTTTRGHSEY